jgi:NAD(P)-dependent dehydrogenase (short-subunit alcohol dehydrogenase family)
MAPESADVIIGVDVCKDRLDMHEYGTERAYSISNDAAAIKTWLEGLPGQAKLALEPTNRYHLGLAEAAYARGALLEQAALAYGGFDSIVVTAGIFVPPDRSGHIPDDKWALTFSINVTGAYIVADEAARIWKEQGLQGTLVLTTSANAVVSKKGSVAYDVSKAAANHLVRELAIELAPLVRVNAVAPATVVQGSAMFPRDRVIASLTKYKIEFEDDEPTEQLTEKLSEFYADRTLTRKPITPADQAEAVFLLLGKRLSKTTGQIIPVDGGLHEAFLR